MRFFTAALLALVLVVSPATARPSLHSVEELVREEQWASFKLKYDKEYESSQEEAARYKIFKQNLVRAERLNEENPEATFGVTQFSDLSPAEFKSLYLGYVPGKGEAAMQRLSRPVKSDCAVASPNDNVDWRSKGAVTEVKDQGQCGSCWAFSAVEGVESAWFLKHGQLPVLSPQQVVSCDQVDKGCNGGDLPPAFEYIQKNGLETESAYPYTSGPSGITGKCKYSAASVAANITGFTYATPPCTDACSHQDEALLLSNLASTGPSSICVYAEPWQTYVSGVLSAGCRHQYATLDHCVQLVGYQAASPKNYWIVRNSWGTSWGQKGYIYLAYGSNVCGLADEATFVTSA